MRKVLLLSVMTTTFALTVQAAPEDLLVKDAIRAFRFKITFQSDLESPFGEEGAFILQQGQIVSKKDLQKKEPYCVLTPDSVLKKELMQAVYEEDQVLIGYIPDDSGYSLTINGKEFTGFSFGKKSFAFITKGTFHDSERGGYKGSERERIEIAPGSVALNFDCKNLSSEFSIRELQKITGESVFKVEVNDGPMNPYLLPLKSSYMKKLEAKKKAEAEAKKAKEKAEKEAALEALGAPAEASVSLKDMKLRDAITFDKTFKLYVTKSGYEGLIYQDGKDVGILGKNDEIYIKKTENFDQKRPYCKVQAARYLQNAYTLEVPVFAGIYTVVKVTAYENIKHFSATFDADVKVDEVSATEVRFSCENTTTVEDLYSIFGDNLKVFIK